MPISINNSSVLPQDNSRVTNNTLNQLSSGSRINSAADDAAGSAISARITSQLDGFDAAVRNANDSISAIQVADGALNSLNDNISRIQELALQAGNGALNDQDREALQREADQLIDESSRLLENTNFNGKPLLSNADDLDTQLDQSGETITLSGNNLKEAFENLGFKDINLRSQASANEALETLGDAQELVTSRASELGAVSNRIESTVQNIASEKVNAAEARSRISDTDFAKASTDLAANLVRNQAQIAVQAQANGQQNAILQLLS